MLSSMKQNQTTRKSINHKVGIIETPFSSTFSPWFVLCHALIHNSHESRKGKKIPVEIFYLSSMSEHDSAGYELLKRLETVDLVHVSLKIKNGNVRLTLMVLASNSSPSLATKNSWTSFLWSPWSWMTSPISLSATIVPLQANFFLMTLRIFFWSNFLGRPWTVVKVLRPFRCWIRIWI